MMNVSNHLKATVTMLILFTVYNAQSQYTVKTGSSIQQTYLTKWEYSLGDQHTITSANIREEPSGLVIVGSVTTPFVEEEMFRVGGSIGLNAALDFKTPGSVISWGNGSDAASLNFLSKSQQQNKPVLSLDGANALVGIGTLLPQAKFHIKCYEDEAAEIFLEPFINDILDDPESDWNASLFLGTREHGVIANKSLGLVFFSDHDYIFNQGTVKMRGLQLYTGETTLAGNILVCTGPEGNALWLDPSEIVAPGLWAENENNDIYRMSNVGIGTDNPRANFHVDGNVVIGTDIDTPEGFLLYVDDGILTERVKVAVPGADDWSDHVFAKEYKLMELNEVEKYIKVNKHLPGVPSAEEVVENGVDLLEMNAMLLEKIEELTLYVIEQQKTLDKQQSEIEALKRIQK